MKRFYYLYPMLLLLCCGMNTIHAQEISDYSKLNPDDYTKITLPPLDLLFENAKKAPSYELSKVNEEIERKMLAKEKRAFFSFFSLRGSYQYGMFGNETTFSDVATPIINSYSTAAQNGYSVGAAVNIPLDAIFDLGARIKRQKLNVRSAELETEVKLESTKKEITVLYATANAQLKVLKMRAEALVLADIQYDITEKNFANGTTDSGTLSIEKERQSKAQESFENSKFELTKSLMILEIITHTSILKSK
ncbi:MAG: TolC family protein [Bacteroides sp.]